MRCELCSTRGDNSKQSGWLFLNLKRSTKLICPNCVFTFTLEWEKRTYQRSKSVVLMVTGGRNYSNAVRLYSELDAIHCNGDGIRKLICGDSKGADYLAVQWALARCVPYKVYKADWENEGKSAGPKRNSRMIKKGKPDVCLSFPGGKGTKDATEKAAKAKVKVYYVVGD